MNAKERRRVTQMLDTVRVNRTFPYHWVFARYGTDGESFFGVWRWPADAMNAVFDLRREADRSRIIEGQVWFLDGVFVFRCPNPHDAELRYGFDRNLIDAGFRDVHPWIREGRYRLHKAEGDFRDASTWFADPADAARVAEDLRKLGVGASASPTGSARPAVPAAALDALDDLDELDTLDALDL